MTSTAYVHIRENQTEQIDDSVPRPDLDAIRDKLAAHIEGPAGAPRVEAVPSAVGDCKIAVTTTDSSLARAAEAANLLTQAFADAYRREWRRLHEQVHQATRLTAHQAERDLHEAQARVEQLYERHERQLREQQDAAKRLVTARASPGPPPSRTAENPEWIELHRQVEALRQHRTELLIQRTAIHPEVLNVDARVQQIEQQLAATPRSIAGDTAISAPEAVPPKQEAGVAKHGTVAQVDLAQLKSLKDAVARAKGVAENAAQAERRAWWASQQEPNLELELAQVDAEAQRLRFGISSIMAALAVGLTTVAGLGMISTGAAIEPAMTSVAQVEAATRVPVIAIVPDTSSSARTNVDCQWQRVMRAGLIACGVAVLVACLVMLFMAPAA